MKENLIKCQCSVILSEHFIYFSEIRFYYAFFFSFILCETYIILLLYNRKDFLFHFFQFFFFYVIYLFSTFSSVSVIHSAYVKHCFDGDRL